MRKTLAEIASIVGGEVVGDESLVITGLNGIKEANEGDLTFISNSKYLPLAQKTKASAIIISEDIVIANKSLIRASNPSIAFSKIASHIMDSLAVRIEGVHPSAHIPESAMLGNNVSVGPCVVIGERVKIGENSSIWAGTFIGEDVVIGNNCVIHPNVTVREKSLIGNNIIIHSGTVIGSDGFGYEQVDGKHQKIPQLGIVVIEDDVEIGSNVTIDRARFDKTLIGRGTKIDNLVQIAHNVVIGENCIIISQVGIAGSVTVKDGVILAGQAGIAGHLTIGEGAVVVAQAGVSKDVAPYTQVSGYPARAFAHTQRINAHVQQLPTIIKGLKERIKKLEDK